MHQLLNNFAQWKVEAVSRVANNAAHILAKLAVTERVDRSWLGVTPSCIREVALSEQFALIC
jgi:hypothetical protein